MPEPPPKVPDCRDVHDLPFLHLAVAGRADMLVTGDADLLAVATSEDPAKGDSDAKQPHLSCRVLTLQTFLDSLNA